MRIAREIVRQDEFFELAERFRRATEPTEIKRLGERLGRTIFGE